MNFETLLKEAEHYQLNLTHAQSELLVRDMELVLDINEIHNLTAITEESAFVEKHLLDSVLCDLGKLKPGSTVLDIGTGGGFPGIPLAICYPDLKFTLMDATEKKIRLVGEIAEKLGLNNVRCICGRAEVLAKDPAYRENFDAVVSRGVAAYRILAELCLPFVKPGGFFYAWKGPGYTEELTDAANALKILKGKITGTKSEKLLKSNEVHVIIECHKEASAPAKYPRNYGAIKKKPL